MQLRAFAFPSTTTPFGGVVCFFFLYFAKTLDFLHIIFLQPILDFSSAVFGPGSQKNR